VEEKVLIVIPTKLCSERVPKKNIRKLAGRPMINYVLGAALESNVSDQVVVSSESGELPRHIDHSQDLYFFGLQPKHMAYDPIQTVDVAIYWLKTLSEAKFTTLILLQPDCPFTSSKDIEIAYDLFVFRGRKPIQSVISVEPGCSPYFMYKMKDHSSEPPEIFSTLVPAFSCFSKVSDFVGKTVSQAYLDNGAIFIVDVKQLLEKRTRYIDGITSYIMPPERSWEVDNEFQFQVAECLMKEKSWWGSFGY